VFVAPGFSEPGGCASHARKIAEGLAERGWSVRVVTRLGSGRSFRREESEGLRITEIPGFGRRRLGGVLFVILAIPLVVFRRRPYAYMAMQLSSPATVASVAAIVHRSDRLLVFSTLSGPIGEVAFLRGSRLRLMRRFLLRRASVLIGQTEEAAGELREFVPHARVEVVPTPVYLPEEVPPLCGTRAAVYTGRIVRAKNLDRLIEVWPDVLRDVPDARLTLVGSGTHGDKLEEEIARRVASRPDLVRSVTLTGWVSDVTPYLDAADVFIFPTTSEGMSNSLLEACAQGRIVVASDIPANRAALGNEYPLLFPPNDSQAFVRVLRTALTDKAIRAQARTYILNRVDSFSELKVLARIEELVEGGE
jgi:glycosyltransferase involved in cell wall biosynthesis